MCRSDVEEPHDCPRPWTRREPSESPEGRRLDPPRRERTDSAEPDRQITNTPPAVRRSAGTPPPEALAVRDAPVLPTIERVKALLALCLTVDDAAEIRDQARAVEAYYSQRADCLDIQNQAAAVRLRAERRIGEILRFMPKNKGGRPPETGPSRVPVSTLEDIGITKNQASIWQRIAALADDEFEQRVAEAQENGLELTTSRVLRGPPPEVKARAASLVNAAEAKQDASPGIPTDVRKLARAILNALSPADVERLVAILQHSAAAPSPTSEPKTR